jgi:hypothetical protein
MLSGPALATAKPPALSRIPSIPKSDVWRSFSLIDWTVRVHRFPPITGRGPAINLTVGWRHPTQGPSRVAVSETFEPLTPAAQPGYARIHPPTVALGLLVIFW